MLDYLNSILLFVAFIAIICLVGIIFRIIWENKYKTIGDIGFLSVILATLNGSVWSVVLPYAGMVEWMIMWRIGYTLLFITGLTLLLFSRD